MTARMERDKAIQLRGRSLPQPAESLPEVLASEALYVFVLGPGTGESIVLRLPSGDWVVIDSYKPSMDVPLAVHVLKKYEVRKLGALVLTHPHEDHYLGMPELLDFVAEVETVAYLGTLGDPAVQLIPRPTPVVRDDGVAIPRFGGAEATLTRLSGYPITGPGAPSPPAGRPARRGGSAIGSGL